MTTSTERVNRDYQNEDSDVNDDWCVWRVCRRGSIKDNDNRQQGAILGGPEYSQTLEKHQLFIDN